MRCSGWEDRQSDPLTYLVDMTFNGFQLPLSFGQWWSPYAFFEFLPSSLQYTVRVTVVDW